MSYPSPLQIETKSTAKPFSFFIGETQVQDLRRKVLEQINEYQRQNVMFFTSEQKEDATTTDLICVSQQTTCSQLPNYEQTFTKQCQATKKNLEHFLS